MGKKLSPYGRKEWHRKHSGNKTVHKSIDAVFRGAGAIGGAASKMPSGKTGLNVPIKFVFISLAVGCLGFFIASASCGLGMSFVCGVVVFWVALSIFSMIHGTAKGIKDGYLQGDAKILMMQSKFIHPTLNGWVRWIWLILGKTQRFWLRSS